MRQADELSMTMAPAAATRGQRGGRAAGREEDDVEARIVGRRRILDDDLRVLPAQALARRARRGEQAQQATGNLRSARAAIMSSPTRPVAPTMPTFSRRSFRQWCSCDGLLKGCRSWLELWYASADLANVGLAASNPNGRMTTVGRGCVKTHGHFVFGGLLTLPHSKIIEYSAEDRDTIRSAPRRPPGTRR